MRSHPAFRAVLAALALVPFAGPARAWDRDTHAALVNAALRLCPAAAARIPAGQQSTAIQAAAEADLLDRDCLYHAGASGAKAPPLEAERALERLRSGKGLERPYVRAQAVGRYLHFVADSTLPASFLAEGHPYPASELFANRSFVVFFDGRPLTTPLSASLLERSRETGWGDSGEGSLTSAFRSAVNATAQALLLMSPEPGASPGEKEGPVLFFVNAIDNGLGSKKVGEKFLGSTTEQTRQGPVVWDHYVEYLKIDPASGRSPWLVSEKPGLHILEWNVRTAGAATAVRALLFNNSDTCATKVSLAAGRWKQTLPIRIGPRGLRVAEFEAPPGLAAAEVFRTWTPEPCSGPVDPGASFPTHRRVIVGLKGQAPSFNEIETRVGPGQGRDASNGSLQTVADQTTLRDAKAAADHNQALSGKMKVGDRVVDLDERAPFFGKESVAEFLQLSAFQADTSGCPDQRARVYGSVKNVSRMNLRALKALIVIGSLKSGEHNGQVQSMDPSDLVPGEEAEINLWLSCDWARRASSTGRGASDRILVVLGDVAGRPEKVSRPDGTNPFQAPPPAITAAPAARSGTNPSSGR